MLCFITFVFVAVLSEGEEGKTASYDERLQKLASVTGLPIDQVRNQLVSLLANYFHF